MTGVSLERLADTLYPKPEPKNGTAYGTVESVNADGSYQVKLNASATTTRCAKLCDAEVGDRVLVLIQANGHCAAIGRVGGSKPTVELLWTNPAPSSVMESYTVNFPGGDYDAYIITSTSSTDYGVLATCMLPSGVSANISAPYYNATAVYRNVSSTRYSITFAVRSSNKHCIPTYIWGVRY